MRYLLLTRALVRLESAAAAINLAPLPAARLEHLQDDAVLLGRPGGHVLMLHGSTTEKWSEREAQRSSDRRCVRDQESKASTCSRDGGLPLDVIELGFYIPRYSSE